jgi:hypothetical protein
MRAFEILSEKWSKKYKNSINCSNPKGFSQKAHCAGRNKSESINEAEKPKVGREMPHPEDRIVIDGSKGAFESLDELESMANSVEDVTVKWDGSPAIFFGRNEAGEFVLTDIAGFTAKGYRGKVTSADDLESMVLNRGKEVNDQRKQFANSMKGIWNNFAQMVEPNFRGYLKGDLLYYTIPPKDKNNDFVFTPNTVTYNIPADSSVGQQIARSQSGVVVHKYVDFEGNSTGISFPIKGIKQQGPVLILPPVVANELPTIDTAKFKSLRQYVAGRAGEIDKLLDDNQLAADKMGDFKNLLYRFVNEQTETGSFSQLNKRFLNWVNSDPKVSAPKKAKIQGYIKSHAGAFEAVFAVIEQMMTLKDDIVSQLDQQQSDVRASIDGQPGGEGYVKGGKTKLVRRLHFTAANRAKTR